MLMIPSALALLCLAGSTVSSTAVVSTISGQMTFEFLADDKVYFERFQDISESESFDTTSAACTISNLPRDDSDPAMVAIQCEFELQDQAEGRKASLDMNLDLGQIPADGSTLPLDAMEIHYQESVDQRILYLGTVADARIWIVAPDPAHAFLADVAIIFHDQEQVSGSRVLTQGRLAAKAQKTNAQPKPLDYHDPYWCYAECEKRCYKECDQSCNINDSTCQTYCYADCRVDCANQCMPDEPEPAYDPAYDEDAGCGGSEEDTAGCGEVWVDSCDVMLDCSASTYPEDDYDDTGCESSDSDWESDDSGCESSDTDWDSDDSGCEGDTTDSESCEGDAYAATSHKQRVRAAPLRALMRFFPELVAFVFIHSWRRRHRRG